MSTVWTCSEKKAHRANRDKNRMVQSSDWAKDAAMIQMAQAGPRALLKIRPVSAVDRFDLGYFGTSVGMSRRSSRQIAKLLGLKAEDYTKCANIYYLKSLPAKNEFKAPGCTRMPDVVALPLGKSAGLGGIGASSAALHQVGASFGVMKLLKDPQHWSINGH